MAGCVQMKGADMNGDEHAIFAAVALYTCVRWGIGNTYIHGVAAREGVTLGASCQQQPINYRTSGSPVALSLIRPAGAKPT